MFTKSTTPLISKSVFDKHFQSHFCMLAPFSLPIMIPYIFQSIIAAQSNLVTQFQTSTILD